MYTVLSSVLSVERYESVSVDAALSWSIKGKKILPCVKPLSLNSDVMRNSHIVLKSKEGIISKYVYLFSLSKCLADYLVDVLGGCCNYKQHKRQIGSIMYSAHIPVPQCPLD